MVKNHLLTGMILQVMVNARFEVSESRNYRLVPARSQVCAVSLKGDNIWQGYQCFDTISYKFHLES